MPGAAADAPRRRRQLLLLGGGHAHLSLLQALAGRALPHWDVRLVTPHARLLYSGMLPGWVAGAYALDDCAIDLTRLARRAGIGWHTSAAVALALDRAVVRCADGVELPFERVSIDTGPEPALQDLPGAAQHALPVRPLERFVAGWPEIVARWRACSGPFELVVIGDGAAAVELAFAARGRARRDAGVQVRVSVLGRSDAPLHDAAPATQRRALALLQAHGIGWRGRCRARRIDRGAVELDDATTVPFDACLVATGAAAPHWPAQSGLATDARGFIQVDRTLRSVSHPQVFAAGDVAALTPPRPKSGVYAVRAGPVLAHNVLAACSGNALRDWHPQARALYLLGTGDDRALASWAGCSASGAWAWRWKDRIDRAFVRRFQL
jgi:selenide,water dikinase